MTIRGGDEKASIVAVLVHVLVLANSYLVISHFLMLVCGGSGVHWPANCARKKHAVNPVPTSILQKEPLFSVEWQDENVCEFPLVLNNTIWLLENERSCMQIGLVIDYRELISVVVCIEP